MAAVRIRPIVILALLAMGTAPRAAPDIAATGGWSPTVGAGDLQGGAGTDLVSSQESVPGVGAIDVTSTSGPSDAWRVDVHRSDVNWNGNLSLGVRRSSDGSGAGSISGGTAYQTITTSAASFFSGTGDRTVINVQLRIQGLSVALPVDTYTTTIVYTLVDTL